jgi:hypothetical protein
MYIFFSCEINLRSLYINKFSRQVAKTMAENKLTLKCPWMEMRTHRYIRRLQCFDCFRSFPLGTAPALDGIFWRF